MSKLSCAHAFAHFIAYVALGMLAGCDAASATTPSAEHANTDKPMKSPRERRDAGATPPDATTHDASVIEQDAGSRAEAPTAPPAKPKIGRASQGSTPLPCELRSVLATSCQSCHASSPGAQAPMALTTLEDWKAPSVSQSERTVFELARLRVHNQDAPMPPSGRMRLDAGALAVIDAASRADLEAGPALCNGQPMEQTDPSNPTDPLEAEIGECYRLSVHGRSAPDDDTPYLVPAGESNVCFVFEPPWGPAPDVQVISIRSHNGPLVHHWILSDMHREYTDGQILATGPLCVRGARRQFGAFARNQQARQDMPEGVGLLMPSGGTGVGLTLSMHYNNLGGDPTNDDTYVEICTAKTRRPNTAEVLQLGPGYFMLEPHRATTATGTCTVTGMADVHILRSFPHMHARGRSLDTLIQRADGKTETLIDMPFNVDDQLVYDTPATLHTGDKLLTTCHWQNDTDRTIVVGEGVEDEMCINFVTVWPRDALINGRDLLGADGCLR